MINISDKFTAKTMDGIVADSHQIQYEQGKTTQRGDTVADKITELEGKISSIKTSTESMEKAVVNSLFDLKTNTYTKAESDDRYALKTDSYTKVESDGRYALKTDSYTKVESDGRYALKTDSYTKAESNKLYPLKKDVYDKQYMDEKFKVISSGLNDFDERSNSFATKADVPFRFVKMSQSEYDNLAQKDENTIYIIL